jgi:aminoglycoside 3-N-acetyltransferase
MMPLTRSQIAGALQTLGIGNGQILFVHSSLRSLGYVAGGADTVVDALLDVVGPAGTLVVPTFTFAHSSLARPVFDPRHDASEMGRISEVARTWEGAQRAPRRSVHLLHSVAALGAHAAEITAVHGPSAWAADGPFWQLYELDATIVLLGVPYLRCTFFHVLEQLVQVHYRQWVEIAAHVREPFGQERPLPTLVYRPKPGFPGNDLNKLGALLEEKGLVHVGAVGNAVTRCFSVRKALAIGLAQYRKDPLLFVKTGADYQPLREGVTTGELYKEKTVFDPLRMYSGDTTCAAGEIRTIH